MVDKLKVNTKISSSKLWGTKKTRARKKKVSSDFGGTPMSVLHINRGNLSKSIYSYQAENAMALQKSVMRERAKKGGQLLNLETAFQYSCANRGSSFSIMPPELVMFYLNFYASKGQNYIDPFAGQAVRMQTAKIFGANYYGFDVCKNFIDFGNAVREKIDDGTTVIKLFFQSSESMCLDDNFGDFCFTSPPYWDCEHYDDHPDQAGVGKTYDEFLQNMSRIYTELYRVMKKDSIVVINVGDFRKDKRFYFYSVDTVNLLQEAGFIPRDMWVIEGLIVGFSRIFAVRTVVETKIAPRNHEYAIVVTK